MSVLAPGTLPGPSAIHLDTSWLIRALVPDTPEGAALREWLASDVPVRMSAVAWAEFLCGPGGSDADHVSVELARRIVRRRIPVTDREARSAARLFNAAGRRRGSLAHAMIAATAILDDARLATVDTRDFAGWRDEGLELI